MASPGKCKSGASSSSSGRAPLKLPSRQFGSANRNSSVIASQRGWLVSLFNISAASCEGIIRSNSRGIRGKYEVAVSLRSQMLYPVVLRAPGKR